MKMVNDLFLFNCTKWLETFPSEQDQLPKPLETRLTRGIIEINGVYLFHEHVINRPDVLKTSEECSSAADKISFELDHNEICMLDYFSALDRNKSRNIAPIVLSYGIITSYRLATLLKPFGAFQVLHSFGYNSEDNLISSYVSFYKIRDDQPDWTEDIKDEVNGLMLITTNSVD